MAKIGLLKPLAHLDVALIDVIDFSFWYRNPMALRREDALVFWRESSQSI